MAKVFRHIARRLIAWVLAILSGLAAALDQAYGVRHDAASNTLLNGEGHEWCLWCPPVSEFGGEYDITAASVDAESRQPASTK
jgi:hypothetical protein